MNRIQFMTELASLLQDIPVVERKEAMQYYNDYFDDAGEENEQQVIKELESPQKVAEKIRADFGPQAEKFCEYREDGYKDTRFEQKEMPAGQEGAYSYGNHAQEASREKRKLRRILLLIALILCAAPVVLPLAAAFLAIILGCFAVVICLFLCVVLAAAAATVIGLIMIGVGIALLLPEFASGIASIGIGLAAAALGVMGTVGSVKLCCIVFPAVFRGVVWLCRLPFRRRVVS